MTSPKVWLAIKDKSSMKQNETKEWSTKPMAVLNSIDED